MSRPISIDHLQETFVSESYWYASSPEAEGPDAVFYLRGFPKIEVEDEGNYLVSHSSICGCTTNGTRIVKAIGIFKTDTLVQITKEKFQMLCTLFSTSVLS